MASVAQIPQSSYNLGITTANTCWTGLQAPLLFKSLSFYSLCITLILATTYLGTISAAANFSVKGTEYNCSTFICLGEAHKYNGPLTDGIEVGRMSLVPESPDFVQNSAGLVYYNEPVRLVDNASRQAASFNTSFKLDIRQQYPNQSGDGMAFVISADNSLLGSDGYKFGIFSGYGSTSFKTIVVEFGGFYNAGDPCYDINDNHVSFDFSNITTPAAADATTVGVFLWDNITIYAWVEYDTQQLEVRVAYNESRPIDPLLKYAVNLVTVSEEYMWVGFSGGNAGAVGGGWSSNYYVEDWNFSSYGIPLSGRASGGSSVSVGIVVGIICVGIVIVCFVKRRGGRRRSALQPFPEASSDEDVIPIDGMPEIFKYEDLTLATGDFSEESKLGEGGFGSVYRGELPSSGVQVAVKKIKSYSVQGGKEFMAEVSIINQCRHRNLIQLLGWCKDTSKRQYLIVYELMCNQSLDKWLFRPAQEEIACLSWRKRFNIVKGTALALEYLHHGCTRRVIHRDVKCSNIMLDDKFNAKLGDFGLSRLVDRKDAAPTTSTLSHRIGYTVTEAFDSKYTQKSTSVAGTPGYIAPEAIDSHRCTDKTDVYAFGVVVLEVACGRRAYARHLPPEEEVLVDWVWQKMREGELLTVVEGRLGDYDPTSMEVMLKIGLLCTHCDPEIRPSMRLVVRVLAGDTLVPSIPPNTSKRRRVSNTLVPSSKRKRVSNSDFLDPDANTAAILSTGSIQPSYERFSNSNGEFTVTTSYRNISSNSNSFISTSGSFK